MGIKFYKDKYERNYALQMQELSSYAGLAPQTGKKIDHCGYYGYYTQHAQALNTMYDDLKDVPRKIKNAMSDLSDDIFTVCEHKVDMNWNNFAYVGKQLVCIDFGYSKEYVL